MNRFRRYGMAAALLLASVGVRAQDGLGAHARGSIDPLFLATEMLGRPTDTSITVNAAAKKNLEVYYEYGTKPGVYSGKTDIVLFQANAGVNVELTKLLPNTRYYYRMRYREAGTTTFNARPEYSFHTARPPGSTFSFVVSFDDHMDDNSDDATMKLSMQNIAAERPDFYLSVGDNFFTDKLNPLTGPAVEDRVLLLRSYYQLMNHSTSMFLTLGGHEGENPGRLNGTADNLAVWDTIYRKKYIPNPEPNAFYTATGKPEPFMGMRQANYAWTWGDALFIVLDPYWNKPKAPELGTGEWGFSLGREQYEWMKKTLETSKAKYKFIFAHSLIGGQKLPSGGTRGGIEGMKWLEMGGYNTDGTWGWDQARPGWAKPIHNVLADNKATIFFKGHDHTYVSQQLDGVIYQTGPQPSASNIELNDRARIYNYENGTVLGGTGHLLVTVSPDNVKVDYVQTWVPAKETKTRKNQMIGYSYTVKPH